MSQISCIKNTHKILAILVLITNGAYLLWLAFHVVGKLGVLFFTAETMIISLTVLFSVNHWRQLHTYHKNVCPTESLDIFLTVVDEPIAMFEKTLRAASGIAYSNKQIYVLDDGSRASVKKLATAYHAVYLARGTRVFGKAGNLNYGFAHSSGDYILVLDADQVVDSVIAKDLLAYFTEDLKLAIITTRQRFDVPEHDFNHDILFYEHMQTGKNDDNAAISCGSGVFYRRSALEAIGGFQTWNIVEDLYTSYVLHINRWKSMYINMPYTIGTAPIDLSTIYKQRGTWALDTFRLFFRKALLFSKKLSFRQKLHYTELAWAYFVSAIAIPILFFLPPLAVLFNIPIVTDGFVYLLFRIPSLALILYFYYELSGKTFSTGQFWASLSFVYLKALILSFFPGKVEYTVTNKLAGKNRRDIALVLPHLTFIVFSIGAVVWRVFFVDDALTSFVGVNMLWMALMIFWFIPVIRKGFLLE